MQLHLLRPVFAFSFCFSQSISVGEGVQVGESNTAELLRPDMILPTFLCAEAPSLTAVGRSAHRLVGYPAHRQRDNRH